MCIHLYFTCIHVYAREIHMLHTWEWSSYVGHPQKPLFLPLTQVANRTVERVDMSLDASEAHF